MKKTVAIALIMVMLLGMVACDKKENEAATTKKEEATTDIWDSLDDLIKDAEDEWNSNLNKGKCVLTDDSVKTLKSAIDAGYDCWGMLSMDDIIMLSLKSDTFTSDEITKLKENLAKLTVADFADKYDASISHSKYEEGSTFYSKVGSIDISFEVANGAAAIAAHKDESFYSYEDADEIKNDVLTNIKIDSVNITARVNKASVDKINALEDDSIAGIKAIAEEIVFEEVYYEVK